MTKLKEFGIGIALLIVDVISLRVRIMTSFLLAMGHFYSLALNDVRIMLESMSQTYLFNRQIKTNFLSSKPIFSSLRIRRVKSILCHRCKQ